jgi:hypothetical protein
MPVFIVKNPVIIMCEVQIEAADQNAAIEMAEEKIYNCFSNLSRSDLMETHDTDDVMLGLDDPGLDEQWVVENEEGDSVRMLGGKVVG